MQELRLDDLVFASVQCRAAGDDVGPFEQTLRPWSCGSFWCEATPEGEAPRSIAALDLKLASLKVLLTFQMSQFLTAFGLFGSKTKFLLFWRRSNS